MRSEEDATAERAGYAGCRVWAGREEGETDSGLRLGSKRRAQGDSETAERAGRASCARDRSGTATCAADSRTAL